MLHGNWLSREAAGGQELYCCLSFIPSVQYRARHVTDVDKHLLKEWINEMLNFIDK